MEARAVATLLREAVEAYRSASLPAELLAAGTPIRTVLSWYNHSVRLAIDKEMWPRRDLSALALKLGADMLPPATPCEFVEESLCWWAFGQHNRNADWLGHGYFWRPIPENMPADFHIENAAGNAMNDFDCVESGFRRLDGKVLAADYSLLRRHFQELQGKSNDEVDGWLMKEAAWLSEGQARRLAEGGDHHHLITSKGPLLPGSRSALRVRSGGRAATFIVADRYRIDDHGNFRAGMLDVKGVGTHVRADISSEKVTGLLGLADALREMAFQRLVQRLLELEGLSGVMGTVPYYAIIDTGLAYCATNPATGWTGESCVLLVRQRQSRLFDSYEGMNFSGICPDAVHSVGPGREMRRVLHSWGISAEFEPRAVFHGHDASEDEVLLADQSGTWNLQADAACTHFMDFSDFYVLPRSPLPDAWCMSEEALRRAFSLERTATSERALHCSALAERLWGQRDPESAAAACLELRKSLSKQKELRDAAVAVDEHGVILPMKPKYCMCWFMELDDSPMSRWCLDTAREYASGSRSLGAGEILETLEARFLAKLHRRRFEATRAAHPWETRVQLVDVLTSDGLAFGVGVYSGAVEVLALSSCSKVAGRPIKKVLPALRALYPGHIYVHGGYDGQRRLLSIERLAPFGDCWEPLPPMSDRRAVVAADVVAGKLYVCGGWDGEHRLSQVERYNIAAGCWEQLPPMLERRSHPAVATLCGKLYVSGGFDGAESLSSVECFDPSTSSWCCLPQMQVRRRRAIAVVMAAKLYICGGFDGAGQLNFAESYDPQETRWDMLPPMLARRVVSAAEVICGKLYVFGSEDDARVVSSVESYDPRCALWEALPPMQSRRVGAAAASVAGCFYVCGGWDGRQRLDSAERYNPATAAWEALPPMSERRDRAAIATIAGRLYVCGGFDGDADLRTAECFDPSSGRWLTLPPMQERRSSAVAVAALT
ncbi:Klhl18 [Symbiodinium natans]|uniref:Klhl18 protein n=1 Tax=Symbiodinium natans TaxID=878477 RepID=A0A812S045_9DINO|nr:Klhl18 [Symbiodinium natans]